MASATLDVKEVANNITLNVTLKHHKQWRVRLAVGAWLIRLAAWVMWMNVEFKEPVEIEEPVLQPRGTMGALGG
jgi:hypothetical protein